MKNPTIKDWATAISKWEGSIDKTNPGNLKYAPLIISLGGIKGRPALDGGNFATFKTPEIGFNALCNFLELGCLNQLQAFHQSRTLESFTKIYAGNPPQGYINGIVKILGVPLDYNIYNFYLNDNNIPLADKEDIPPPPTVLPTQPPIHVSEVVGKVSFWSVLFQSIIDFFKIT